MVTKRLSDPRYREYTFWFIHTFTYMHFQIAPEFLRTLPTPSSTRIQTLPWLDSLVDMWGSPLPQPLSGYNAHDNFYAKSILVPETTPLSVSKLPYPFSNRY